MSYDAPFAGLRVLEVTQGVAEPYAAMLLAQYGADVVKVEPPAGDWSRTLGTRYGEHSALTRGGSGSTSDVLPEASESCDNA